MFGVADRPQNIERRARTATAPRGKSSGDCGDRPTRSLRPARRAAARSGSALPSAPPCIGSIFSSKTSRTAHQATAMLRHERGLAPAQRRSACSASSIEIVMLEQHPALAVLQHVEPAEPRNAQDAVVVGRRARADRAADRRARSSPTSQPLASPLANRAAQALVEPAAVRPSASPAAAPAARAGTCTTFISSPRTGAGTVPARRTTAVAWRSPTDRRQAPAPRPPCSRSEPGRSRSPPGR